MLIALLRALGRRARLARVVPARLAAVADRPGALLLGGHQPARAAARAPLAQPRVGAQRRARAARPCSPSPPRWRARTTSCGGSSCSRTSRLGLAFGVVLAWIAAKLVPRGRKLNDRPAHAQSLYALGVAFAIYGIAVGLPLEGNGFIAVFTGAITLGILRPDLRVELREPRRRHRGDRQARDLRGVRLAADRRRAVRRRLGGGRARRCSRCWSRDRWRSGSRWRAPSVDTATKGFMAWFGPKGVATMTFSLLVLGEGIPDAARIFNLAALCVFASVLAHGLTDTPGAEWLARRARAACSWASGNAHAACRRRSCLNTKRSCCGGRSPSGWSGRNVGHGSSSASAQSMFLRKKQSSQLTFLTFLTATTPEPPRSPVRHKPGRTKARRTGAFKRVAAGVPAPRRVFLRVPARRRFPCPFRPGCE